MSHFKPEFCTVIEPGMQTPTFERQMDKQVNSANQTVDKTTITATQKIEDLIPSLDSKQLTTIIRSAQKRLDEINSFKK